MQKQMKSNIFSQQLRNYNANRIDQTIKLEIALSMRLNIFNNLLKSNLEYMSINSNNTLPLNPYIPPQWCLTDCDEDCMLAFYQYGFIISAVFSIATFVICLYNVMMHFVHFNNPYFQSKIILIVLMPPAYCLTSTLSFLSVSYSSYITLARDLYQGVGLLAFFYLIFSFIAYDHDKHQLDQKALYVKMYDSNSEIPHDCPCNYFQKPYQISNWRKAKFFSNRCKRGVLQYIIIKIVFSIFFIVVYPNYELRNRSQDDWDYQVYNQLNTYMYWISTISSYVAYYYMSMFYNALQAKLRPFKPDLKFMTFNTTMYYTYWQKVWMVFLQNRLMACFDQSAPSFYSKKLMYCIENFLICIQMFIMAIAVLEAYNYTDYVVTRGKNKFGSIIYIIKDMYTIFMTQLRLFKPKDIGFHSKIMDIDETELMTISTAKASHHHFNIIRPIQQCFISHYF